MSDSEIIEDDDGDEGAVVSERVQVRDKQFVETRLPFMFVRGRCLPVSLNVSLHD